MSGEVKGSSEHHTRELDITMGHGGTILREIAEEEESPRTDADLAVESTRSNVGSVQNKAPDR